MDKLKYEIPHKLIIKRVSFLKILPIFLVGIVQ
jgi:hypothetical protein